MAFTTHSTKSALQRLLPSAEIIGGSFVNELPQINCLSATEARSKLKEARDEALSVAMNNLKDDLGNNEKVPPKKTPEGFRIWPDGYTGSVTHKGPILLGAVAKNNYTESLGIDLEFDRDGGRGLSHVINEGEIPDHSDSKPAVLGVFSTKESVYKAYYPVNHNELDFDDVYINWIESYPFIDYGVAKCPDSIEIEVQCLYQERWIISTAQLLDSN